MKEEFKHYTIEIEQDESPESPREWDNLGTMYCSHREYDLGDKQLKPEPGDFVLDLTEEMEKVRESDSDIFLPLFLYDHSGIWMSTARVYPFNDPWDSGCVGFIHVPASKIWKEYSVKRITKAVQQKAVQVLIGEVETYNQFISGDVYCYTIETPEGESDSLYGLYGYEYAVEEAKNVVRHLRAQRAKELRAARKQEREAIQFERLHFAL